MHQHFDKDVTDYLEQVVKEEQQIDHDGTMPSYMEAIGKSDRNLVGICAMGIEGQKAMQGNADEKFPLESASKPLSLALALEDSTPEELFRYVGREPTADPYHSVAVLEEGIQGKPSNPMINAGAIVCTSRIKAANGEERFDRLLNFIRDLAGNPAIDYNRKMFEVEDKDLNRALFYFMRSHGFVEGGEEEKLIPYLKQSSIEMDCADLARIASVFANKGKDPASGHQLISERTVGIVLTLMLLTGMYDESGRYAVDVGIPSKSGMSGSIMAVAPGRMGLGLMGPALDDNGNSIAGFRMLHQLSRQWNLAIFP